eukprot:scaffold3856_cov169-Amphora_coffeaeformis.AAC.4
MAEIYQSNFNFLTTPTNYKTWPAFAPFRSIYKTVAPEALAEQCMGPARRRTYWEGQRARRIR